MKGSGVTRLTSNRKKGIFHGIARSVPMPTEETTRAFTAVDRALCVPHTSGPTQGGPKVVEAMVWHG